MRAVLAGELDTAKAWDSDVHVKLEVQNGSGTWIDVGYRLGSSWIVNASWGEHIDNPVSQATFQLIQKIGSASLAPLMSASTLNVDDIGNYAPLLNIGRLVRASTATMAAGVALDVANYRKIFEGRIDHVSSVDGEYDYGPITIRCSDLGGWLMDQQIETEGTEYGTTPGTALQTVLQSVVNDNLPSGDPAVTVVKQSPSTFLVTTWNQGATKVMEALRTLVLDSVGEDIRYRFNSSHNSTLQWFDPDRTRVSVDATFTANQYVLRTLDLHLRDIRNKGELPYTVAATGLTGKVTKSSLASIAKYRTRFFRLPESKMLSTSAEAQTVLDRVVSDLAEPPAEAFALLPYSWYVQLYDRYTFAANNQQYDQAQTFGVVGFEHSITDGRGTTQLTVTARIVGAYAEWNRRISGAVAPELRILNFREEARTDSVVPVKWESKGEIAEFWLYLSTPAQPGGVAVLTGVPTARLTAATTGYDIPIPRQGLVTYGRLFPMSASAQRGNHWDFTVQPGTAERLIQRAKITATSPTEVQITVAVANPTPGSNVTIAYTSVGGAVSPVSGQTILAVSVTDDIDTTGTVVFTATRPSGSGGGIPGAVIFTATSTDRLPDVDTVTIPAQDLPTTALVGTIATAQIADAAVTAAKIGAAAVEEAKIAAGAVVEAKLGAAAVTTAKLANLAVTDAILAAGAVTTTKITDTAVTSAKIAANTIVAGNIAAGTITTTEIAANTIVAGDIAAGTITATEIAAATITGAKIAALTIAAGNIAANAIETDKINANAVTAGKISVTNLAAINADLGTVTAGHIKNSGNTAAIRMSGATALPSTNYLDFTATTTALFMKAGGIEVKANGEVTVSALKILGSGSTPMLGSVHAFWNGTNAIVGTDTSGRVDLERTTVGTSSTGVQFRVTFATAYATAPHVLLTALSSTSGANVQPITVTPTATYFEVSFHNTTGIGSVGLFYHVIA